MAKQITLNHNGVDYVLEFNRKTVQRMELAGFSLEDTDKPVTFVTTLFHGAFMMHHRHVTKEQSDEIWFAQKGRNKLLTQLVAMYSENVTSLMDEDDAGDDEPPTWKLL